MKARHAARPPEMPTRARRGFPVPGPRTGKLELVRQDYSFLSFFIFLSETRAAGFLSSLFSDLAAVGAFGVTFLSAILCHLLDVPCPVGLNFDGRILNPRRIRVGDARHQPRCAFRHEARVTPITPET